MQSHLSALQSLSSLSHAAKVRQNACSLHAECGGPTDTLQQRTIEQDIRVNVKGVSEWVAQKSYLPYVLVHEDGPTRAYM